MSKTAKITVAVIVLVAALFALSACDKEPEYDFVSGIFRYKFNGDGDDTVTIVGLEGDCPKDVVIPATVEYDGKVYKITQLGEAIFAPVENRVTAKDAFGKGQEAFNTVLETITFEEGSFVTDIGGRCFLKCSSLKEVNLPESLKTIGGFAFRKCLSLEKIVIPSSVTLIGNDSFGDCTALKTVELRHSDPANLPKLGERVFKWYDSSKQSFMGSTDPYTIIGGLNIVVTSEPMKQALINTKTSTDMSYRTWSDYSANFVVEE